MLSIPSRRAPWRAAVLPLLALTISACADEPTRALAPEQPRDERPASRTLGVVEITISGLTVEHHPAASVFDADGTIHASVIAAPSAAALERIRAASARLDGRVDAAGTAGYTIAASTGTLPGNADASGDGTIQLEPISTGSFTVGTRGDGGYRYVSATYRVRNAQRDGTPYDTPRRNLTFYAIDTGGTLGQTAISRLERFDGNAAATDPAALLPTGAVRLDPATGHVLPATSDVLQVLSEEEAVDFLAIAGAGTETVFPYGFVVRNPSDAASRTLPADPAPDQFDGLVTFAFKIPLAARPEDDPFMVSAIFMAVDDDEVRVTQSLEEQTPEGQAAFEGRAAALGADQVVLLFGGGYNGTIPSRMLCSVRAAGSVGSPASIIGTPMRSLLSIAPTSGLVSRNASFSANFSRPVTGFDASNFSVRGLQSGRAFQGETYSGNGTSTITTPMANFFPGEEVEIVLIGEGPCDEGFPRAARVHVAAAPATASFDSHSDLAVGRGNQAVLAVDLNRDGRPDLIEVSYEEHRVVTYLNDGAMTAPTVHSTPVGWYPQWATTGDLDGDGYPDLIVSATGSKAQVLLGNGDGTFRTAPDITFPATRTVLALGDLNGDGKLDLATVHEWDQKVSILFGKGDGTFHPAIVFDEDRSPGGIAIADLDGDGKLDVVAVGLHWITAYLGDGQGGFTRVTESHTGAWASVAIADLNGDGTSDLAVGYDAGSDGALDIFFGKGDGTFNPGGRIHIPGHPGTRHIAVGDLDGDGDLDLVAANRRGRAATVLMNDGTGSFTLTRELWPDLGYPVIHAAIGDMNGDGTPEIIVPSSQLRNTRIYWNTPSGGPGAGD